MSSPLHRPEFPRSSGYDPAWVIANAMGPNPLWLAEWLTGAMRLAPGMRVLDLGCGRAATSVFLAQELGVQVHAADLWTDPDDNWRRVVEVGEGARVTPIRAEAHALPFAAGYFDAIVSVDAWHYFGTDVLYLHYLSRFLREGGTLAVAMPGLMQPFPQGQVPVHLTEPQVNGKVFWEDECVCFRTLDWWREQVAQCPRVRVTHADTLPDGWRLWRDWEWAVEASGLWPFPCDAEALERDGGEYLGFVRIVAERTTGAGMNLYEPGLAARLGL